MEILIIAGWFHDTGYLFTVKNHEEKSVEIATEFLIMNNYPSDRITRVNNCIMATKISKDLNTVMEFVIRDADLISLGKNDFYEKNNLLKEEMELRGKKKISNEIWIKRSIKFLSSHSFLTEYAKNKFDNQLKENILMLKKEL